MKTEIDNVEYLGVIIHNEVSRKPQISSLRGKPAQVCGVVCKLRN